MTARALLLATLSLIAVALPCDAQRRQSRFAEPLVPGTTTSFVRAPAQASGTSAFLIEAAGGIVGSLAGFALIYSADSGCDTEDLVCQLRQAGTAVFVATIAAASGVYAAGRLGDTEPSLLGAILGAVAGAAAGIGTAHLVTEELDWVESDTGAIVTFGVTQGITAALGSRVARAIK